MDAPKEEDFEDLDYEDVTVISAHDQWIQAWEEFHENLESEISGILSGCEV